MLTMLYEGGAPPSYKAYKNSKFTKHNDKIKNQLQQINSCSLHADDKKKLKLELIEQINKSLNGTH